MKNKMLKRSHLSEKTCKDIVQLFADDLTATQIASITRVSRVTINNYLKLIRNHIARHCEEQREIYNRQRASDDHKHKADGEDSHSYYGFYSINENIFTDELPAIDKPAIREMQNLSWTHQSKVQNGSLHRYHAIADFEQWRLYRIDNHAGDPQDDISVFWGHTRHRLMKFRGLNKNTLYLHVKESEFRYNYRGDDINTILLNIIHKYPLHLARTNQY